VTGTDPSPPLRRLPVPQCEPPYDDERPGEPTPAPSAGAHGPAVQGALALSFVLPSGLPATPEVPPDLRLVPPPDDDFGPRPTARAALPEPRRWGARLVQAVVEVLAGERPVAQLLRWTTDDVYAQLVGDRRPPRTSVSRAVVRSIHVCEPVDGVAEVAATVRQGPRTVAVALRLEGLDGRWLATALVVG
jgi:hypothetical protein